MKPYNCHLKMSYWNSNSCRTECFAVCEIIVWATSDGDAKDAAHHVAKKLSDSEDNGIVVELQGVQ